MRQILALIVLVALVARLTEAAAKKPEGEKNERDSCNDILVPRGADKEEAKLLCYDCCTVKDLFWTYTWFTRRCTCVKRSDNHEEDRKLIKKSNLYYLGVGAAVGAIAS